MSDRKLNVIDPPTDTVQNILNMMHKEAGLAASLRAANITTELAAFVESFVSDPIAHELGDQQKRIAQAVQLKFVSFLVLMDKNDALKEKVDQVKYGFGQSSLTLWVYIKDADWNKATRSKFYIIESALRGMKELSHIELDFMLLPARMKEVPSNLSVFPLPADAEH